MALHTSTLILYKNSALEIDRNFMVDSIADYLATLSDSKTISSFQYIKHGLAINIKIDITQATLDYISANNYNYCSIKNDDGRLVYYYIVGKQWRGQSTIELNLQMDTINTFKLGTDYTLSKQSVVNREHKDRWISHENENKSAVAEIPEDGLADEVEATTFSYSITIPNPCPNLDIDDVSITLGDKLSGDTIVRGCSISSSTWVASGSNINCLINLELNSVADVGKYFHRLFLFEISYNNNIIRKIDLFPENINPQLFKTDLGQLYDGDTSSNWYVIYKNANAVVSNPSDTEYIAENPVQILLCKDSPLHLSPSSPQWIRLDCHAIPVIANARENVLFCYDYESTASEIKIEGTTYTLVDGANVDLANHKVWGICWTRVNNNDLVGTIRLYGVDSVGWPDLLSTINNVSFIDVYKVLNANMNSSASYDGLFVNNLFTKSTRKWYIGSGTSALDVDLDTIDDVDRTNSQLIKIIALPYAPYSELVGIATMGALPEGIVYNSGYNMLEVETTNTYQFVYDKVFNDYNPASIFTNYAPSFTTGQLKNISFESKLYNSEFYYQKFVYGNSAFSFAPEYMNTNADIWEYRITYAVSQSVQSKFLFQFTSYITNGYDTQDYNNVLLVGMNNEKAIYSNSYINYLRTGLNYDTETKNKDIGMKGLAVGLSAIGTIASFISAPFTGGLTAVAGVGLATSTFTQVANMVHSANQSERNIQHKKQSLAMQGENVSQVEDIDLLEVYSENKPKMVEYHPSEIMKNALYDLFFYCGYATREYKIPSFSGRKYFNFVMADIKYSSDTNLPEDIKEDIKNKYAIGITCLHKVSSAWDFAQQYENYETSLE